MMVNSVAYTVCTRPVGRCTDKNFFTDNVPVAIDTGSPNRSRERPKCGFGGPRGVRPGYLLKRDEKF